MLLSAICLALGIVATERLATVATFFDPANGTPWVLLIPPLFVSAVSAFLIWRCSTAARRRCLLLFLMSSMFGLGAARFMCPVDEIPIPPNDKPLAEVHGTLLRSHLGGTSPFGSRHTSILLGNTTLLAGGSPTKPRGRIRVIIPRLDVALIRGSRIVARGKLLPARGTRNPGSIAERRNRRRNQIAAVLAISTPEQLRVVSQSSSILGYIDSMRLRMRDQLFLALPTHTAALATGLVLGDRSLVHPSLLEAAALGGTIHFLAISGLHLAWVLLLSRFLSGSFLGPRSAGLFACLITLSYACFAGAGSPVLRASLSTIALMVGKLTDRRSHRFNGISLAAIVLLLIEPGDIFLPGFQLSFVAVLGLLTRNSSLPKPGTNSGLFRRALGASLKATIATMPLVWIHFGRITPLAPLVSVLIAPIFLTAFAAAILVAISCAVAPPLLFLTAPFATASLNAFSFAIEQAAKLPFACLHLMRPGEFSAFLPVLSAFLFLRHRVVLAMMLILACLLVEFSRQDPPDRLDLWVLDVGHGQAAILNTPRGRSILIDCGSRGHSEVGRRVVIPALDALGIACIDVLILSHSDADHLNGADDLMATNRVRHLVVGRPLTSTDTARTLLGLSHSRKVSLHHARRGDVLLDEGSGGLKIEVIAAPSGKPQLSSNDDSLVLMATYRSKRLLFPGDLESAGISSLLQENVRLGADVMLLPHHGNRDPMVGPLVHRVAPAIALASRASTLRGSPMDSIVTRTGAQLLDTASLGALRIQIDGESAIEVSSYLRDDSWFVETAPGGVSR